ncbi:MAG: efflux RND transporter permease subunit, partial [Aureliella sp.]
ASPIGEIYRYILSSPINAEGSAIYSLNDLKSLQDWTIARELQRLPGIAGVVGCGGTVKRYEIRPDPNRMRQYGITLDDLETAISQSNANVGGSFITQGNNVQIVRAVGLIGGGEDPLATASGMTTASQAARYLRNEDRRRLRELRQIVIRAVDNIPVRVGMVVEGGPIKLAEDLGKDGVVVDHQIRQGQVGFARRTDESPESLAMSTSDLGVGTINDDDVIQGIVLLRKGEKSLPALQLVKDKIDELNHSGKLLPGVVIIPYYDRTSLIAVTTDTVHENLLVGLVLVTSILLAFLGNVRTAIIVAINIPLALMFAFGALMLRGKSANLLSIGAVDFGIIVDSTVIMVEHIYRRLSHQSADSTSPIQSRVLTAALEVQRSLFFSTLIMVCALLPLFTLRGPEGQIFGPMADTYAFALGGALLLALTVSPVLCSLLFKRLKPAKDNFLVRTFERYFVGQLEWMLHNRALAGGIMLAVLMATLAALPMLGREFMPELEEGNMVIRGTFPANVSLEAVAQNAHRLRGLIIDFPEVKLVGSQVGRPDDGTDPTGVNELQCFVPLRPMDDWPIIQSLGRRRTKAELVDSMSQRLENEIRGASWDFSQIIRDNVMESLSGVKGENSIKIFGPDLAKLETLANQVQQCIETVPGVTDAGVFHIQGQTNLAFSIDRDKCAAWGVRVADIDDVVATAVGGSQFSEMIEGEKRFDIALRWPLHLRDTVDDILRIPVDIVHDDATYDVAHVGAMRSELLGTQVQMPVLTGTTSQEIAGVLPRTPRRRLGDLVTPANQSLQTKESSDSLLTGSGDDSWQNEKSSQDITSGQFDSSNYVSSGASVINREQGRRLIAVKFSVRDRDLASTVAAAQAAIAPIVLPPYSTTWSGEFQQMQEAERRMLGTVLVALTLILVMLYLAFLSLLDAFVVYMNVVAMSLGGVWALLLTGLNFNISAAVGFISILGVAVMNGLLMVGAFNNLRRQGHSIHNSIIRGTEHLVRPIAMTALAAILGLLPAALATKVGSQSQRPLAIVVVGGMAMTLLLFNLVPLLYSFYGGRSPLQRGSDVGH